MSKRITLVSVDCGSGHACGLALGLEKYGTVTKVWENRNKHGLDYLNKDAKFGYHNIPKAGDDLIIVACITYDRLKNQIKGLKYKRIHIIITDGRFARDPDYYNSLFNRFDILTTGCKRHFREPHPVKTYYQPFDLSHIDQIKPDDNLTISHSPFTESKFREKGTKEIIKSKNGVNFDLITGVSWDECLQRKAKSHIFVDQIDHYDRDKFKFKSHDYVWPALGKSGIEAMHLGCLVITHGKAYTTEIPPPPIAWCVKDSFREVLDYYISHPIERHEMARIQKAWALEYASYDYQAKNVLQ